MEIGIHTCRFDIVTSCAKLWWTTTYRITLVAIVAMAGSALRAQTTALPEFAIDSEGSLGYADDDVCREGLVLLKQSCSRSACSPLRRASQPVGNFLEVPWQKMSVETATKSALTVYRASRKSDFAYDRRREPSATLEIEDSIKQGRLSIYSYHPPSVTAEPCSPTNIVMHVFASESSTSHGSFRINDSRDRGQLVGVKNLYSMNDDGTKFATCTGTDGRHQDAGPNALRWLGADPQTAIIWRGEFFTVSGGENQIPDTRTPQTARTQVGLEQVVVFRGMSGTVCKYRRSIPRNS